MPWFSMVKFIRGDYDKHWDSVVGGPEPCVGVDVSQQVVNPMIRQVPSLETTLINNSLDNGQIQIIIILISDWDYKYY